MVNYRLPASSILISAILAISGCQSGSTPGALNAGGNQQAQAAEGQVLESELRAFCPPVTLREGTAFYNSYQGGGQGDASKVVYQASISEVTRACKTGTGGVNMTVAVAGRVVPGPLGKPGTITVPIRVAAVRGSEVVYSQLYQHKVTIADTSGATQFIFNAPNVAIPGTVDRNVQVFVGYDEG